LLSISYGYRSIEAFVLAVCDVRQGVDPQHAAQLHALATLEETVVVTAILEAGR